MQNSTQLKTFIFQILFVIIAALIFYIILYMWTICEEYNERRREKIMAARRLNDDISRLRSGKQPEDIQSEENSKKSQKSERINEDGSSNEDDVISSPNQEQNLSVLGLSGSQLSGNFDWSYAESGKTFKSVEDIYLNDSQPFTIESSKDSTTPTENNWAYRTRLLSELSSGPGSSKSPRFEEESSNFSEKKIKDLQYETTPISSKYFLSLSNYGVTSKGEGGKKGNSTSIVVPSENLSLQNSSKVQIFPTRSRAGNVIQMFESSDTLVPEVTEELKDEKSQTGEDETIPTKDEPSTSKQIKEEPEVVVDKLHTLVIVDENGAFVECFQFRESDYCKGLQELNFADKFKKDQNE